MGVNETRSGWTNEESRQEAERLETDDGRPYRRPGTLLVALRPLLVTQPGNPRRQHRCQENSDE